MRLVAAVASVILLPASGLDSPRTLAYRNSGLGSIQRQVVSGSTSWKLEGHFYACAGPPGEAALYGGKAVIHLDLEGRTVAGSARRASPTDWRIFGDPAIGGPRMGKAHRVNARWNVYRWGTVIGYTRGPDGPAASLALMFC